MSRPKRSNVTWVRPERVEPVSAAPGGLAPVLEDLGAVEPYPPVWLDLARAVEEFGLPAFPDLTPEEELRELLLGAAEIEHGLMIQYLYAADSCTDATLAARVREIAVEEMGHLITVENLLLAAGGAPYFGRYDRSPNDFDPFTFRLEPFTFGTVAKYAACEMPDRENVDPEELEVLTDMLADASGSAGALKPHRIGLLYLKIYWLLRESDAPLPDPAAEPWENFPLELLASGYPGRHASHFPAAVDLSVQAKEDDWQENISSVIVATIEGRGDALRAVARISAQGEGFAHELDGHFDRFVGVYREAKAAGPLARNFLAGPWYEGSGAPPGAAESQITSALAVGFATLGDRLYEILLIALTLALHPESGYDGQRRSIVAHFCISIMRDAIKPLARDLPRLKVGDTPGSRELSMCYTLPAYPDSPAQMKSHLAKRYDEAVALAARLATEPRNPAVHVLLHNATKAVKAFLETSRGELDLP